MGTVVGDNMSPSLRRCFTHELPVEPPDGDGRQMLLEHYLGMPKTCKSNIVEEAVRATNGFCPRVR